MSSIYVMLWKRLYEAIFSYDINAQHSSTIFRGMSFFFNFLTTEKKSFV
jgi:hypothetical protein